MLRVEIIRNPLSYQYKRYPKLPGDWHNNDLHNDLDLFNVYDSADTVLMTASCQSIANMEGLDPSCSYKHTLKCGEFLIKAFVDQRQYWPNIHGICEAENIGGEYINDDSITPSCNLRMLVHDWESLKPKPKGSDTRVAWSDGCIILHDDKLEEFNQLLIDYGYASGDFIHASIQDAEESKKTHKPIR